MTPPQERRPVAHPRRRIAGRAVLAACLGVVLASPAMAQESPTPPPPSPQPSPSPSPSPAPTVVSPPPDAAETLDRDRRKPRRRPSRKRRREQRRTSEQRRDRRREVRVRPRCEPFSHTQTYLTWGPAVAYGEPVTVVYAAERCTRPRGTSVEVSSEGSATVYRGSAVAGEPIDRRPFILTGTWDRPTNAAGWPLAWWGCGVKQARYRWEIPGVYLFDVGARWGVWSLTVSTLPRAPQGEARDFHWSYNGC
jgi:hypothetical protein